MADKEVTIRFMTDAGTPNLPVGEQMHPALWEAACLLYQKELDYGATDPAKKDYHPFGHESYLHMLNLKLLRLKNLREKQKRNEKPLHESAKDTCLDLINYAAFYYSYLLDEEEAHELEELQQTGPLKYVDDEEEEPSEGRDPETLRKVGGFDALGKRLKDFHQRESDGRGSE